MIAGAEELSAGEARWSTYPFDVITVNARGQETDRRRETARRYVEDLGNGVTLEMVAIPGGTFLMGSPKTEKERMDNEGPQHQVTLAPFLMGEYPVTQEQWEVVMGNNPSRFKGAKRPVENVSWNDVQEFLKKLNEMVKNTPLPPSRGESEKSPLKGGIREIPP